MAVSQDDVRHVAALARLGLSEDRVQALVNELNGILLHMDELQKVHIEADTKVEEVEGLRMRDDIPSPIELHREISEFAPSSRDGFFLVPRLATHESGNDDAEGEG